MRARLTHLALRLWRSSLLRQFALLLVFVEVYQWTRAMIMQPNDWDSAMNHAAWVMHAERVLHLGWEVHVQQAFLRVPELVKAMNLYYFICQFAVTGLFMLWLFFRDRAGFYLLRNAVVLASLVGFIVFWRFPTAPPRIAEVGVTDTLRSLSNIDIGHSAKSAYSNPLAAVPSLHVTWALGVAYGLWRFGRRRLAKSLALLYPLTVVATIIATGNHFVLDAVAGAAVLLIGFAMALLLERRLPAVAPARDGPEPVADYVTETQRVRRA